MKKLRTLNITNTIIKLAFFIAFPAAWATGFSGVKYLCERIHSGKPIEMTAFLIAFLALAGFTIVFGRFFCGRACAFGTYGDILHELGLFIAKKLHKKLPGITEGTASVLRYLKYIVLTAVCLLCILGHGSEVSGASPWTAFSNLRYGQIKTDSELDVIALALFAACSLCMIFVERFFCRFLCPFGAVFSLLPVMPWALVSRSKPDCLKGCKACRNICPASLDIPYRGKRSDLAEPLTGSESDYAIKMGECIQCGKCAHLCPRSNAGSPVLRTGSKGIIIDIVKALALAVILYLVI